MAAHLVGTLADTKAGRKAARWVGGKVARWVLMKAALMDEPTADLWADSTALSLVADLAGQSVGLKVVHWAAWTAAPTVVRSDGTWAASWAGDLAV